MFNSTFWVLVFFMHSSENTNNFPELIFIIGFIYSPAIFSNPVLLLLFWTENEVDNYSVAVFLHFWSYGQIFSIQLFSFIWSSDFGPMTLYPVIGVQEGSSFCIA